ncbi:hypothetical protein BKA61DRAFT_473755 [Leptodontidium sp. MPI-SDFR-AT-0119]|nr:hypothetical protein BKA61DRAFT_473755 [Leptodontidium sp. MPI-SDFR-AT-0119]
MNINSVISQSSMRKEDTYYEATMRWIENMYLRYFGQNRTSYGIKDTFSKTEVTGNKDVDSAQHAVGETVGNVFADRGVSESVGKVVDKGLLTR